MGNISKTPQRCSLYVHEPYEPYQDLLLLNCSNTTHTKAKENIYLGLNKRLKTLSIHLFEGM